MQHASMRFGKCTTSLLLGRILTNSLPLLQLLRSFPCVNIPVNLNSPFGPEDAPLLASNRWLNVCTSPLPSMSYYYTMPDGMARHNAPPDARNLELERGMHGVFRGFLPDKYPASAPSS